MLGSFVRPWDSIPVRLGLGTLLITVAAFMVAMLMVGRQQERQFTADHLTEARKIAAVTATELVDLMMAGGGPQVWDSASAKAAEHAQLTGTQRILVLNSQGVVKAGSDPAAIGARIESQAGFPEPAILADAQGMRRLRIVNPLPVMPACKGCHAREEETHGHVAVDFDLSPLDATIRERRRGILAIGLIAGVAVFLLTALLFRRLVMRPVQILMRSVERLASGDLGARSEVLGRNELAVLARNFNDMAGRIQAQVTSIDAARTESALLYTLVVEASKKLEIAEFATGVVRVISERLHPRHTALFLQVAGSGWLCATAGKEAQELLASGEGALDAALASDKGKARALLNGIAPGLVADACRARELRTVGEKGELTFALPVVADAQLIGLLACLGIPAELRVGEDLLVNIGAHLTLSAVNSRNYSGAITDALTGLKNKQYGMARLGEALFAALRYKSELALAMCDIDFFKRVNDTYGHPAGDAVLREVSRRITSCIRKADIAVRYGGEEFMLILPAAGKESLAALGEKIRQAVAAAPVGLDQAGLVVPITLSVGIAAFHGDADNGESLLARADKALYRAKEGGRNRVEVER
jgi:diguanylate cyclase (GGDEF)-like protein